MSDTEDTAALIARAIAKAHSYDGGKMLELVRQEIRADREAPAVNATVAPFLAWESYTCRCGEPVQHDLSTKYCPGSDVEGPLWADYLSVGHEDHVHWAMPSGWRP